MEAAVAAQVAGMPEWGDLPATGHAAYSFDHSQA